MVYHSPQGKKVSRGTGAKRRKLSDKRKRHKGRQHIGCRVAEKEERRTKRTNGGGRKHILVRASYVNVSIKKGECKRAKILSVLESHNPHYVRRNIITLGCVVNTDLGKVKITSRPGQHGVVNGILL